MRHNYNTCDLCGDRLGGADDNWWPHYDIDIGGGVRIEPIFKIWDGRSEINMLELCDGCVGEMKAALSPLLRRYRSPIA